MGVRGHKGKHNAKGGGKKKEVPPTLSIGISCPINAESPNMDCEEAPIILANHYNEHYNEEGLRSPQIPMNDNLS
jgi:hypothetical protein